MMAPVEDHYAVLGVSSDASAEDIQRAYRSLAWMYHPDRNHGNEAIATTKFQQILASFEVLKDEDRRRRYDRTRPVPHPHGVQSFRTRSPGAPPPQSSTARPSSFRTRPRSARARSGSPGGRASDGSREQPIPVIRPVRYRNPTTQQQEYAARIRARAQNMSFQAQLNTPGMGDVRVDWTAVRHNMPRETADDPTDPTDYRTAVPDHYRSFVEQTEQRARADLERARDQMLNLPQDNDRKTKKQ
ncbi:DnaJ domain-containing protein [Xylariaceae sp. FL0255]|nr:DnaJ domain-containing protein [Xylariaceae sp. FL0255]